MMGYFRNLGFRDVHTAVGEMAGEARYESGF